MRASLSHTHTHTKRGVFVCVCACVCHSKIVFELVKKHYFTYGCFPSFPGGALKSLITLASVITAFLPTALTHILLSFTSSKKAGKLETTIRYRDTNLFKFLSIWVLLLSRANRFAISDADTPTAALVPATTTASRRSVRLGISQQQ